MSGPCSQCNWLGSCKLVSLRDQTEGTVKVEAAPLQLHWCTLWVLALGSNLRTRVLLARLLGRVIVGPLQPHVNHLAAIPKAAKHNASSKRVTRGNRGVSFILSFCGAFKRGQGMHESIFKIRLCSERPFRLFGWLPERPVQVSDCGGRGLLGALAPRQNEGGGGGLPLGCG